MILKNLFKFVNVCLVVLFASPLFATMYTTLDPKTYANLLKLPNTYAFLGKVTKATPQAGAVEYTFDVLDAPINNTNQKITVGQPLSVKFENGATSQARVQSYRTTLSHAPQFAVGQVVFLLLSSGMKFAHFVGGENQGLFYVKEPVNLSDLNNLGLYNGMGNQNLFEKEGGVVSYDSFKKIITGKEDKPAAVSVPENTPAPAATEKKVEAPQ